MNDVDWRIADDANTHKPVDDRPSTDPPSRSNVRVFLGGVIALAAFGSIWLGTAALRAKDVRSRIVDDVRRAALLEESARSERDFELFRSRQSGTLPQIARMQFDVGAPLPGLTLEPGPAEPLEIEIEEPFGRDGAVERASVVFQHAVRDGLGTADFLERRNYIRDRAGEWRRSPLTYPGGNTGLSPLITHTLSGALSSYYAEDRDVVVELTSAAVDARQRICEVTGGACDSIELRFTARRPISLVGLARGASQAILPAPSRSLVPADSEARALYVRELVREELGARHDLLSHTFFERVLLEAGLLDSPGEDRLKFEFTESFFDDVPGDPEREQVVESERTNVWALAEVNPAEVAPSQWVAARSFAERWLEEAEPGKASSLHLGSRNPVTALEWAFGDRALEMALGTPPSPLPLPEPHVLACRQRPHHILVRPGAPPVDLDRAACGATGDAVGAAMSPDGRSLAVACRIRHAVGARPVSVRILGPDLSGDPDDWRSRDVALDVPYGCCLTWSPDGSTIAWTSGDESGPPALWLAEMQGIDAIVLDSGGQATDIDRQIPSWSLERRIAFSPDGASIVFEAGGVPDSLEPESTWARYSKSEIIVADTDQLIRELRQGSSASDGNTSAERALGSHRLTASADVIRWRAPGIEPAWSPDGSMLAWVAPELDAVRWVLNAADAEDGASVRSLDFGFARGLRPRLAGWDGDSVGVAHVLDPVSGDDESRIETTLGFWSPTVATDDFQIRGSRPGSPVSEFERSIGDSGMRPVPAPIGSNVIWIGEGSERSAVGYVSGYGWTVLPAGTTSVRSDSLWVSDGRSAALHESPLNGQPFGKASSSGTAGLAPSLPDASESRAIWTLEGPDCAG